MKRERKEPDPEGCPLWVVTFGDAMSLLVTFFVMLVSFADFEEHSLQNMLGALKGGLRAVPLPLSTAVGRVESQRRDLEDQETLSEDTPAIPVETGQGLLGQEPAKRIVRSSSSDYYLHLMDNGFSLFIKQGAVFKSGTATLFPSFHEVWLVAVDLMHFAKGEVRIVATLPENIVVRLDGYSTSWGLGIERALAVHRQLASNLGGNRAQMSTSVKVIDQLASGEATEGTVEIRYISDVDLDMKSVPKKILRGSWHESSESVKEGDDG